MDCMEYTNVYKPAIKSRHDQVIVGILYVNNAAGTFTRCHPRVVRKKEEAGGEGNVELFAAPNPFLCSIYLN